MGRFVCSEIRQQVLTGYKPAEPMGPVGLKDNASVSPGSADAENWVWGKPARGACKAAQVCLL